MNRVPELNDAETRAQSGKRFPRGGWVCILCDNTDSDGHVHNVDDILFSIAYSRELEAAVDTAILRHTNATRWN